jgi:hypothetical protein
MIIKNISKKLIKNLKIVENYLNSNIEKNDTTKILINLKTISNYFSLDETKKLNIFKNWENEEMKSYIILQYQILKLKNEIKNKMNN